MNPIAYTSKEEIEHLNFEGIAFMYQSLRQEGIPLYISGKIDYVHLTDAEISNIDYQDHAKFKFARAIEAEVLKRLGL